MVYHDTILEKYSPASLPDGSRGPTAGPTRGSRGPSDGSTSACGDAGTDCHATRGTRTDDGRRSDGCASDADADGSGDSIDGFCGGGGGGGGLKAAQSAATVAPFLHLTPAVTPAREMLTRLIESKYSAQYCDGSGLPGHHVNCTQGCVARHASLQARRVRALELVSHRLPV